VEAVSATRVRLLAGTMDHIQRPAAASRSASYLPTDLRPYGNTFDQYGSWQYDAAYGYVWYPSVGPEWRPYFHGSWSPIRSYGWTWIGLDAWAWPTHHYGRWGYARNAWFWIPGRTWGAAWVSWSFADDYVSWCPLGYDSRPVFALAIGSRRAWDYWTVPRRTFASRGYVHDYSRTRGQSSIASHQSSAASRQSPALGRQSTDDRRPRTGDARLRTDDTRLRPDDYRLRPDDRRLTTAATPQRQTLPAASGGAIAMPRVGASNSVGHRDSGIGIRNRQRNDVAVPRATAPERVYMPTRVGSREAVVGGRESVVAGQDGRPITGYRPPTADYRRPSTDSRPTTDYRRPTTDSRPTTDYRPPTTDSRQRQAPAASGGAPAPRSMPHERAAPSGGDAGPRAQERSAQGQGQSQGQSQGRRR
jgi:hypothetical protein